MLAAAALAGCSPVASPPGLLQGKGDGPAVVTPGSAAAALVSRLDPPAETDFIIRRTVPFGHRLQRWHVYPFTAYGRAKHQLRLRVLDRRMHGCVHVDLFAQDSRGRWGAPIDGADDNDGTLKLTIRSDRHRHYALVVGPRSRCGFLPRYPGRRARVLIGHERNRVLVPERGVVADLVIEPNGRAVLVSNDKQDRWRIERPLTLRGLGEAFAAEAWNFFATDNAGRRKWIKVKHWSPSVWVASERDGPTDAPRLAIQDGALDRVLLLDTPGTNAPGEGLLLVDAFADRSLPQSSFPVNLAAVAMVTAAPQRLDGVPVRIANLDGCDRRLSSCRQALGPDNQALPAGLTRAFRPLAYEPDEPSRYALTFGCKGYACSPSPEVTRYPIYLAHGFNSSRQMWTPVIEALLEASPAWRPMVTVEGNGDDKRYGGWIAADDVPGFRPLGERVEQLRRNLIRFLERLETGTELRVNVIAHSMGGLDARLLMGDERYNGADCGQPRCADDQGEPQACCYQGVPWRRRIASLTTLSSPHLGSAFADWSLEQLEGDVVDWLFRRTSEWIFGHAPEDHGPFKETLSHLSRTYARDSMQRNFPAPPTPARSYDWACALAASGGERCQVERYALGDGLSYVPPVRATGRPSAADLPRRDTWTGTQVLPRPTDQATVYSWAGQACFTGTCGQLVSASLALAHKILRARERYPNGEPAPNDGVVSQLSATRGIYMGLRNNDHFTWSLPASSQGEASIFDRVRGWIFGLRNAPPENFYLMWLDLLRLSGY